MRVTGPAPKSWLDYEYTLYDVVRIAEVFRDKDTQVDLLATLYPGHRVRVLEICEKHARIRFEGDDTLHESSGSDVGSDDESVQQGLCSLLCVLHLLGRLVCLYVSMRGHYSPALWLLAFWCSLAWSLAFGHVDQNVLLAFRH